MNPVVNDPRTLTQKQHTCSEGGQLGETLFSRSSNADQQRVALHHPEYALNPRQVLQGIVEQHQLKFVIPPFVVLFHDLWGGREYSEIIRGLKETVHLRKIRIFLITFK